MPPLPWEIPEEVWRLYAGPSTRLPFLREALCMYHINSVDEESEADRDEQLSKVAADCETLKDLNLFDSRGCIHDSSNC